MGKFLQGSLVNRINTLFKKAKKKALNPWESLEFKAFLVVGVTRLELFYLFINALYLLAFSVLWVISWVIL